MSHDQTNLSQQLNVNHWIYTYVALAKKQFQCHAKIK